MNNQIQKRLLVADNSPEYRHSLRGLLELDDYIVEEADSPDAARGMLENKEINLALVDLRLTNDDDADDFSGLEIAKLANTLHIPCIIITAFDTVDIARLALRSRGAEALAVELVPKRLGPQSVLDAIQLVLTNVNGEPIRVIPNELKIDLNQGLVWNKGNLLNLTRHQYALLVYLFQREGAVCSPEQLVKEIYHEDVTAEQAMTDRRLERLVERLREKIEADPYNPRYLVRVYGRGYRLVLDQL